MTTREALHRLVDELPDDALAAAERELASLRDDPMLRALALAPVDDEPVTDEDRADLAAARAEYRRGETLSNEDVRRAMGW
jgi:hypothetical protein